MHYKFIGNVSHAQTYHLAILISICIDWLISQSLMFVTLICFKNVLDEKMLKVGFKSGSAGVKTTYTKPKIILINLFCFNYIFASITGHEKLDN